MNGRKNDYTYSRINNLALAPHDFLIDCSENYHSKVNAAAKAVFDDTSKKIVMLAGPSSSGKTTTASLISSEISALGGKAYTVSLDDFYYPHSVGYPLDENGEPDYECVEALDINLIHSCFRKLADCGRAELPVFNFNTGEREEKPRTVSLDENDVIIVEGLHALNPIITDTLDSEKLYKIYVSVSSRVYENDGSVLLSKRDLRFVRRMVRDYEFRSMTVERTFEIWGSVMRGEDKYLFPYEGFADIKLNSFHPCEPCVLAEKAIGLLNGVEKGEYSEKAELLKNKLSLFKKIDYSILPRDSLLREFTG